MILKIHSRMVRFLDEVIRLFGRLCPVKAKDKFTEHIHELFALKPFKGAINAIPRTKMKII